MMTKQDVLTILEEKKLSHIIELIEDAEKGKLDELELAKSLGLLRDESLNEAVLNVLQELGVEIIYVEDDE